MAGDATELGKNVGVSLRVGVPARSRPTSIGSRDELPWITFRAIQWLTRYLRPEMKVFEYGAGGSTLFLARRVRELVSVEHDETFHSVVAERLAKRGIQNCRLIFRPSDSLSRELPPELLWHHELHILRVQACGEKL